MRCTTIADGTGFGRPLDGECANGCIICLAGSRGPLSSLKLSKFGKSGRLCRHNEVNSIRKSLIPLGDVAGDLQNHSVVKFEDVLVLAKTIVKEAVGDDLRRLTLFDRLSRSPDSGPSKQLVSASARYGLTSGSSGADFITVTDDGREIATSGISTSGSRVKAFKSAIEQFDIFHQLYEKLKGSRLPAEDVLSDEFHQLGLDTYDCDSAAGVFIANIRYVGLIHEVSGTERIISIEQILEETDDAPSIERVVSPIDSADESLDRKETTTPVTSPVLNEPSIHIDVQIHIDSTATPEQIDQIFASMARHLYTREV